MNFLKGIIQDARALLRGDKRIAPRGQRGRIYSSDKPDLLNPKALPVGTMKIDFVMDGKTGKKYTLEEWKRRI